MTALEKLSKHLPGEDPALLLVLLEEAEEMILALTGRQVLPARLTSAQVQLALILYNRQGLEGQTSHSEGGVSRALESLPEELRRQIAPYRLAKVVMMHAAEEA